MRTSPSLRCLLPTFAVVAALLPSVVAGQPVPERVAPGVVSTERGEAFPALSPDGETLWFATHDPDWRDHRIVRSRWIDGAWSPPEVAPFSGRAWSDRAPRPSPDGRRLYFASNRPRPGESDHDPRDWDIWTVERVAGGGWGEPRLVPAPVSTANPEYHPSEATSGGLYFASFDRPGGVGRSDLYIARPDRDTWEVEPLGAPIASPHSEPDVYVDPAERFLIVTSTDRPDGLGGDDLYLSVREDDGWSPLVHLDEPVNSSSYEYGASVSPDGRWLWFTSHREGSGDLWRIETAAVPALAQALAGRDEDAGGRPRAARRMAITVDDLPVGPPNAHSLDRQREITERLLVALDEHDVPAIGFVNENKLEVDGAVDPRRVELLERWLDAGLELGNHGYEHLDLHRVDPEKWMADVLRGERMTRPLLESRGAEPAWFRHPFLHTGRSVEVQRRTAEFLADHGYRIAPVTIDNSEWIYGGAYAKAVERGDRATMERLGRDYVRYMLDVVEYYEGQAREIVGEGFPQVLLIHAYALNADWLDPLLDALEARGYDWISLEEALEHPAYARPVHGWTGGGGITWLHRWAITEGRDPAIFRGEPEAPEWVQRLLEDE